MTKRYGGQYSPDGTSSNATDGHAVQTQTEAQIQKARQDEIVVKRATKRANILFFPAIILAFRAINESASSLAVGMAAAAVLAIAAFMLREGLKARAEYDARKVARRTALPRIMLATALTGVGIAAAATFNGAGIGAGVLYGIVAGVLHNLTFGIDPLANKSIEGIDQYQQDRVAKVVREADANLITMREQINTLGDRKLALRAEHFNVTAREMIRTVEEDPTDLTAARKFLGVYLNGAKDATVKFVDLYKRDHDPEVRADYENLLDDLEANYAAKTEKLLSDSRSDMDIEIKVLRDRLQREGITLQ